MSYSPNIIKLMIANFLTGLVFWWGIEKLFLQSIGITPTEIGWMLGAYTFLALIMNVPAGLLADRWSRKFVLIMGIFFLATSAVLQGLATDTTLYLIGYLVFSLYLVCTSGTYHALVYDVAHESGQAHLYSRIMGRAAAFFLCGAGVANLASGFIGAIDLRLPFFLTVIPCTINILLILTIKEPTFHRSEQRGNLFGQLVGASKTIMSALVLRSLVIIYSAFAISELFKQDFSQLYFLAFNNAPMLLGIFWAAYAFAWAIGNGLAHRFDKHLNWLIVFSFAAVVVLPFWRSPWALGLFLLQAMAAAAAHILIETRVQNATPSAVRASVLSVLATSERIIRLPGSILLGWLITQYDVFVMLGIVAIITLLGLVYWLMVGAPRLKNGSGPETVTTEPYAQV